jgi:hypothetical protein
LQARPDFKRLGPRRISFGTEAAWRELQSVPSRIRHACGFVVAFDYLVGRPHLRGGSVTVAKSLWASIQGDPVFMRRVNGWLTIFWLAMIPMSYELGWLKSVVYVSALSLWALVSGHWSAWQAARVEVAQQREAERQQKEPVEEKVVAKIVEETSVEKT